MMLIIFSIIMMIITIMIDDEDRSGWLYTINKYIIIFIMSIMITISGVGTRCVPTPKMAYFSVFKAFLFLKYFENNLGPIESSFNP